jgi:hypothetical protein
MAFVATGSSGYIYRGVQLDPTPDKWIPGWSEWRGINRLYRLLITGHSRSGTAYTTQLLKNYGIDIGHERFGSDGVCSWIHAGNGDIDGVLCAAGVTTYQVVLHQIRHPLLAITSARLSGDAYIRHVRSNLERELPDVQGYPTEHPETTRFWMLSWVEWNRKIERQFKIALRYRIEDLPDIWPAFCEAVGLDANDRHHLETLDTNLNSFKKWYDTALTWDDLVAIDEHAAGEVHDLAREYGYDD